MLTPKEFIEKQHDGYIAGDYTPSEVYQLMLDYARYVSNSTKPPVSGSVLSDVDYWKQRCLLAEQCLEESPCDPDITSDQIKAWNAYHKFISWAGNDRLAQMPNRITND